MTVKLPTSSVVEKLYADSGANRSVYPNPKAAKSYFPLPLDISTASGAKSMKSEGVGTMSFVTPKGDSVKGFDRVIFCKNVSEKLMSVGEMCDAGYIFVFDDKKLDVYLKDEFKVSGKIFTSDERDPRSRLYPITLHRNVEQKTSLNYFKPAFANDDLPSYVEDGPLPAAMLAKSYKRPDLSELDRYHAKFGDVGIKYMKRCMPHLKIPKQYRCDICIDGKIHKFGHKACAEGVRKTYLPGVCIHTDHSGPYAKSLSGARYSQLYLDRGSGYLRACRQKKKTGHYESTPKIFIASWRFFNPMVMVCLYHRKPEKF